MVLSDASAHTVNHALMRNLPFDYARDFAPIARLSVYPLLFLVPAAEPATDLTAFAAAARGRPRLAYSSAGVGSASHLAAFLFAQQAGLDAAHVAYRGGSQGRRLWRRATRSSCSPPRPPDGGWWRPGGCACWRWRGGRGSRCCRRCRR
ncbi:Bug family tripartite tricarboxylate transporter substrate binding protein [Siccirubricoccus deserti]